MSCVLLKNGRLDLLHDGNELVCRCLPITWRGGRYGNGCTRRIVANAGWYVRAACLVLVQKPVHQQTCHVVTYVFLEMHGMKVRCSDHKQYESNGPFVISGTVLYSSLNSVYFLWQTKNAYSALRFCSAILLPLCRQHYYMFFSVYYRKYCDWRSL